MGVGIGISFGFYRFRLLYPNSIPTVRLRNYTNFEIIHAGSCQEKGDSQYYASALCIFGIKFRYPDIWVRLSRIIRPTAPSFSWDQPVDRDFKARLFSLIA